MAAPLGFKTFATGDVLTAADTNGYLMQGVWTFANAAARDAAVTSPQEGNVCYLKDTDAVMTYSGSAWVAVGGGASTSYTPVWTSSGTAPSLGNGTLTGKYSRVGDLVYFSMKLTFGSTTTAGTGDYSFSLPFTMTNTSNGIAGDAAALNDGVAWYTGYTPNTVINIQTSKFICILPSGVAITATAPFSFGTADSILAWGSYVV